MRKNNSGLRKRKLSECHSGTLTHPNGPTQKDVGIGWSPDEIALQLSLCRPTSYISENDRFKWNYLFEEMLSKYPRPGVDEKTRCNNAYAKMIECEDACKQFNVAGIPPNLSGIAMIASTLIADLLGDFDYSIFETAAFSGGATVNRRRKHGHPYYKYISRDDELKPLSVTKSAESYARALQKCTPLWNEFGSTDLDIVRGNTVTTVPKKTDCNRPIALEPCLNMALQRSVGSEIRALLKRKWNVDLNDQSVNQQWAHIGSRNGCISTIDLSSASDMISYRVVWELIPPSWFTILRKLRSPTGFIPESDPSDYAGMQFTWEKFSSMGNGFTFELESLIFAALAKAHLINEGGNSRLMSVYGDDIIIDANHAGTFCDVLIGFGFKPNTDKTHITGPFRESCGKHYHNGVDVTPFYIKEQINTPSRLCWLLNRLRLWAYSTEVEYCLPETEPLWRELIRSHSFIKKVRGGCDIDRIDYVYGPGMGKYKIQSKTVIKKTSGWRGLAAHLQTWQYSIPKTRIFRSKNAYHWLTIAASDVEASLIESDMSYYRLGKNDELWRPRKYLFLSEL